MNLICCHCADTGSLEPQLKDTGARPRQSGVLLALRLAPHIYLRVVDYVVLELLTYREV